MCGVAGILKLDNTKLSNGVLERFTNSLAHRGPDGAGFYLNKESYLGFGHRRLSILDISDKGKQPMSYDNGRYWITYNGEIFNFIEIRKDLVKRGYKFNSESDTEVILGSYKEWGEACLGKFNGMWSFAIWDEIAKKLFIARDRFGVKPLYFFYNPGSFLAFASETIAFSYLDGFVRKIDEQNLSHAITDSFSLEGFGKTIFKGIKQLLPGHYIEVSPSGGFTNKKWWDTRDCLSDVPRSYDDQVELFKNLFEDACRIRMRSDVPIGTALSGGLDSSSVYSMLYFLMKKSGARERVPKDWQRAFVACFTDTSISEKRYAEQVISFTNGQAEYLETDFSNIADRVVETTQRFDSVYFSPLIAASDIYKAMRQAGIKVSLDGHGVDEMMYGYQPLVANAYRAAVANGEKEFAKEILSVYREMQLASIGVEDVSDLSMSTKTWKRHVPQFIKNIYKIARGVKLDPWLKRSSVEFQLPLVRTILGDGFDKRIDHFAYNSFHLTILPTILRNFDRASMQHGVEVRMPFMDWRLVAFVFSLPQQSKIGDGYTKRIVRDAMKGLMPDSIRLRKQKIGLNAPMVEWFSGPLKQFLTDTISSGSFLESGIWDGPAVRSFFEAKLKDGSLSYSDCLRVWPYINAHIIMTNK